MQETDNNQLVGKIDYKLANAINKERKLASIRAGILAMSSEKALDAILDSPFPATLVQSFPDQDLHFLMHHIGEEDFLPVLSIASSQQWEYILDVEVWNNDRLDIAQATRNISLLYKADPQRFIRWAVKEKTEFFEYYLFRNMEIRIREHDEDPSDFGDDFSTIDSVLYFRFLKTSGNGDDSVSVSEEIFNSESTQATMISDTGYGVISGTQEDLDSQDENSDNMSPETTETVITDILNTLADMDISVFQGVLLETTSVIPAEIEEEEFRLKNVRLAEKGFLPAHEAVAVYQPLKVAHLKERPGIFFKTPFLGSDIPLPPRYPSLILKKQSDDSRSSVSQTSLVSRYPSVTDRDRDSVFVSALDLLDKDENIALNIQSEFAFLVNSLVSADKITVRSREMLEKIVENACSYLSLGIEMIHYELLGSDTMPGDKKESLFAREYDFGSQTNSIATQNADPANKKEAFRAGTEDVISGSGYPDLTSEQGAAILRKYAIKDIFRIGSGAGMSLKESVKRWRSQSYIVKQGLSLTFLGENWLGVVGGLLLDRPLFFDNYASGVLYRPFESLEDIELTQNALLSIDQIDKMLEKLNPDATALSQKFLTWKAVFLTLWIRTRMGLDRHPYEDRSVGNNLKESASGSSSVYDIPLARFKPFFIQLLGLDLEHKKAGTTGKINKIIRSDFFSWLSESGVVADSMINSDIGQHKVCEIRDEKDSDVNSCVQGNALSDTARKIFDELFDELEEEYGSISPEDIDPELISHFILSKA